jgi:hypothetical protein
MLQYCTRHQKYKLIARSAISYGSESRTIRKMMRKHLYQHKWHFMRTVGHTLSERKRISGKTTNSTNNGIH